MQDTTDNVPASMIGGPWNVLFLEDWQSILQTTQKLTTQVVFLLMLDTIDKHNKSQKKREICLVHIDYIVARNNALYRKATFPDVKNYLFQHSTENESFIIPCLRNEHYSVLFFHGPTQTIYHADSLFCFDFPDEEITTIAVELGFSNSTVTNIQRLRRPQIQLQEDSISCGIFSVHYCELFCQSGTSWKCTINSLANERKRMSANLMTFDKNMTAIRDNNQLRNGQNGSPSKIGNSKINVYSSSGSTSMIEGQEKLWNEERSKFIEQKRRGRPLSKIRNLKANVYPSSGSTSMIEGQEKLWNEERSKFIEQKRRGRPLSKIRNLKANVYPSSGSTSMIEGQEKLWNEERSKFIEQKRRGRPLSKIRNLKANVYPSSGSTSMIEGQEKLWNEERSKFIEQKRRGRPLSKIRNSKSNVYPSSGSTSMIEGQEQLWKNQRNEFTPLKRRGRPPSKAKKHSKFGKESDKSIIQKDIPYMKHEEKGEQTGKGRGRPVKKKFGRPLSSQEISEKFRSHKKKSPQNSLCASAEKIQNDECSRDIENILHGSDYSVTFNSRRQKNTFFQRVKGILQQNIQRTSDSSPSHTESDQSSYDSTHLTEEKIHLTPEQKNSLVKDYYEKHIQLGRVIDRYHLSPNEKCARVQISRVFREISTNTPNKRQSFQSLKNRTEKILEYDDEIRKVDIHEKDIQRIAIEQSVCFGLKNFRASKSWVHRMKQQLNFRSRHIDVRVSKSSNLTKEQIEDSIKEFLNNVVRRIKQKYPMNKIYNVDQTGVQYEMIRNRTLTKKGRTRVERSSQRQNATTHSFTVNPCISAAGEIIGRTFITLCEPKVPQKFNQMVAPFNDLYVTESTSGIMTSRLAIEWMQKVFLPNVPDNSLLLLDSWNGFTQMRQLPILRQRGIEIIVFPKKTTSQLQPLDLSFNRQFKNFIQKLESEIRSRAKRFTISKRKNQLTIIRFTLNQFKAPRFCGLIQRGFYMIGILTNPPPYFDTPDSFCFDPTATDAHTANPSFA